MVRQQVPLPNGNNSNNIGSSLLISNDEMARWNSKGGDAHRAEQNTSRTNTRSDEPLHTEAQGVSRTPKRDIVIETAIDIIKKEEGFTHYAKWDYAQYSYGYGQKANYKGEYISIENAEKRLKEQVAERYEKVSKDFPNLSEQQQATLISFHFNCPAGYNSVSKNGLEYHQYWCKTANGKILQGLVNRRAREKEILNY